MNVMTSFQVDQQNTYGITRARRAAHVIEFYFRIEDEWWMPFETILITVTEPRQNGLHKT